MFNFLVVLSIIVSILLVLLCLLQYSKKETTTGNVIGDSGFNQIIGVKKTADTLEKLTLSLIFVLFLLCFLAYKTKRKISASSSPILDEVKSKIEKEKKQNKLNQSRIQNDDATLNQKEINNNDDTLNTENKTNNTTQLDDNKEKKDTTVENNSDGNKVNENSV